MAIAAGTTTLRPQSRWLMKLFGFLFAGAILAISATMNWKFGYGLSPDPMEKQLFGMASLAVDGLKATLPLFIVFLWRARHLLMTMIAIALWVLCFSWSMASAVGFSASTRAEAFAGRAGQLETRNALLARESALKATLAALPAHRRTAVVKAELETVDVPVNVWRRTKACTDFTREDSRRICQPTLALRRELAASEEAEEIEAELAGVQKRLGEYAGVVTDADPQVQTLASVMNLPPDRVKLALVLLLATLVEVASAFGITVVSLATSRETMQRIEARAAKAIMAGGRVARSAGTADANSKVGSGVVQERILTIKTADGASASPPNNASPSGSLNGTNGAQGGAPTFVENNVAPRQGTLSRPDTVRSDERQVTGNWVMPKKSW